MPVLHLIAGPHGVGKTTLHRVLIAPRHPELPFVRAETFAQADEQRQALLRAGQSFATESVFSHPSRVALVTQARALGYEVVLYAMALDEPRRLLQRVSQRVREGGHGVPSHKVLERFPRCLDNLRHAVFLADMAFLFDAIEARDGGPRLVASLIGGKMHLHTAVRPRWAEKVLGFAEG
jgi:predicted ABC-type ATPase